MSALRLGRNPDGTRHIVTIDDGAVGRITHTRYGIAGGGTLVTARPAMTRVRIVEVLSEERRLRSRDRKRRERAIVRGLCGRKLHHSAAMGSFCGRAAGHKNYCKSREAMDNDARRNRA